MTGRVPGKICKNGIARLQSLDISTVLKLVNKNN